MKPFEIVSSTLKMNSHLYAAYVSTLFYVDILFMLFYLLMIFGKTASIVIGVLSSVLLAMHIVRLYFKRNANRKVQLLVIDIHLALAIPFIVNTMVIGNEWSIPLTFMAVISFITILVETPLLFILTDEDVMKMYS